MIQSSMPGSISQVEYFLNLESSVAHFCVETVEQLCVNRSVSIASDLRKVTAGDILQAFTDLPISEEKHDRVIAYIDEDLKNAIWCYEEFGCRKGELREIRVEDTPSIRGVGGAIDFLLSIEPSPEEDLDGSLYKANCIKYSDEIGFCYDYIRGFGLHAIEEGKEPLEEYYYNILQWDKFNHLGVMRASISAHLRASWKGLPPW
ncbi:hypothetical protein ACUNKQ_002691 [Salmonella enterica subsp. enterica serovar Agona]|nr:hypothetical protein [Vibrio parahaemolyticus]